MVLVEARKPSRRGKQGSNVSLLDTPCCRAGARRKWETQLTADRRSINRKSAQKHRLRRKEELEDLNKAIMERDARIALLEKELAVERARVAQVMAFLKEHTGFNPGAPATTVHGGQGGVGLPSPPAEPITSLETEGKVKDGRRKSGRSKAEK